MSDLPPIATRIARGSDLSLQFAICREIFRNCRESRSYWLSSFVIISRLCTEFSRLKEQGEFLGIAGKVLGIAGKILGLAGRKSSMELRMVAGFGAARRARLNSQNRPRRACPDSGLIKHCASTEVAGIDPAVGAFQVVHGFEPACPSCRCARAGRTCRNGVPPLRSTRYGPLSA
jgi:hypothetical protein